MKVSGTRYISIKGVKQKSKVKKLSEIINPKSFFDSDVAIFQLDDIVTVEDKVKQNGSVALCKSQKRNKKCGNEKAPCQKKYLQEEESELECNAEKELAYKDSYDCQLKDDYGIKATVGKCKDTAVGLHDNPLVDGL